MPRRVIVTHADLRRRYPDADLDRFEPTHHVRVQDSRSGHLLREDYVRLGELEGEVAFGFVPGDDEPAYSVISTGLWQAFAVHGRITVTRVHYEVEYTPPLQREGDVYFVQSGSDGPIKIGWSQDVARRIAELQTANAHALVLLGTVPGTMEDEATIHVHFAHLRMEAEWFRNSSEIHAFLRERR